jgi:hypothetical protein
MGRPARNHGGTGGHGCFPMPGERPNLNHHVLKDKELLKLVQSTQKRPERSTKITILKHIPKLRENPTKVHTDRSVDSIKSIEPKLPQMQEDHHQQDVSKKVSKFKVQNIKQNVSPVDSKKSPIKQQKTKLETVEPSKQQTTGITEVSNKHERLTKDTLSVKMPKMSISERMPVNEYPQVQLKEKPVSAMQESTTSANPSSFKVGMQGAYRELSSQSLERPSASTLKNELSWTSPSPSNFVSLEKVIIYNYISLSIIIF